MGPYRALARPLLFALPPEAAHRLTGALLRLPLPWKAIGDAVDDPALHSDMAGVALRNPIGLAAGFDKGARGVRALGELGFGYVVAGTVTRRPRAGNPSPRIVRRPEDAAIVNAMGLPNPGASTVAGRLRRAGPLPAPVVVSLADEDRDDVVANFRELQQLAAAIELNVSCPNVSWGRDRDNEEHLRGLLASLRPLETKPLLVKLPPFRSAGEREAVLAVAEIAAEGGADGFTCGNTRPLPEPRLATRQGGLSGRPLFEDTLEAVGELRRRFGPGPAVNACGGIFGAADALACLDAGATTVQIYTGLIYEGPRILRRLTEGLLAERRRALLRSAA
jgi:dihydroorotate dehydrogenase